MKIKWIKIFARCGGKHDVDHSLTLTICVRKWKWIKRVRELKRQKAAAA